VPFVSRLDSQDSDFVRRLGQLSPLHAVAGSGYEIIALLVAGLEFDAFLGNKAFDANWIIKELDQRRAYVVIPKRPKRTSAIDSCGAMRLDVGAFVFRARRYRAGLRHCMQQLQPEASPRPAVEPVIDRGRRAVIGRPIAPAAAHLEQITTKLSGRLDLGPKACLDRGHSAICNQARNKRYGPCRTFQFRFQEGK